MSRHDLHALGPHALGRLEPVEARAVEAHLAGCAACQIEWDDLHDTARALRAVPREMFIDAPPVGDLALRRAMRTIRAEAGPAARPALRGGRYVAAAAAAVGLLAGGALGGQLLLPVSAPVVAAPAGPATTPVIGAVVQGSTTWRGSDVAMSATLTPAPGWVRLTATVSGIPAGRRCTLVLVDRDGTVHPAASWLVSAERGRGTPLAGSAIIDPADVAAVAVRDDDGSIVISLPV